MWERAKEMSSTTSASSSSSPPCSQSPSAPSLAITYTLSSTTKLHWRHPGFRDSIFLHGEEIEWKFMKYSEHLCSAEARTRMALAWEKEETWQRWVLSPVFVLILNWIWVNVHCLFLNWSIFQVFGDEWWSFCFPVFSSFGDGLTFPQVGFLEMFQWCVPALFFTIFFSDYLTTRSWDWARLRHISGRESSPPSLDLNNQL